MADEQELWQQRLAKRRAGTPWNTIASEEGVHPNTFRDWRKKARDLGWIPPESELPPAIRSDGKRVGLPASGTRKVPDEESIRYPEGTDQVLKNSGEPQGTQGVPEKFPEPTGTHGVPMRASALEGTLQEPIGTLQSIDERSEPFQASTAHRELLLAISRQVQSHHDNLQALMERVAALEAENKEYRGYLRHLQPAPIDRYSRVLQSLPEWMRNLTGIPGYPEHPHQDSRLNIHLPEEERWLINAIANGLDQNISSLIRRILTDWCHGEEAQKGLQAHLERRGIQEGTVTGTEQ